MLIRILGRNLHKIIVIVYCFVNISCLDSQRTQLIDNFPAALRTVISNPQNIITLLIFFIFLIYIADIHQHRNIAYSLPVNFIGYCCRFAVCAIFHKLKHLFCL